MNLKITDNAGYLRVEIFGRFAGSAVDEVAQLWASILREQAPRYFTVDVTNMSEYDHVGCSLLRDMHLHGVKIAAASAASLIFFAEISAPQRRSGPALVPGKSVPGKPATGKTVQGKIGPRYASGA